MKKLLLLLALILPQLAHADITSGLITYWTFDAGSGTSAVDSSASGNTGTLGSGLGWLLPGKIGAAALTCATTNVVNRLTSSLAAGTVHSIAMWVFPNATSDSYAALYTQGGTSGLFFRGSTSKLDYFMGGDFQTTGTLTSNAWNHIVITRNGTAYQFYINGVADASGNFGNNNTLTADSTCSDSSSENFFGNIDDLRVYNRVLSQADVTELYNYTGATTRNYPACKSMFCLFNQFKLSKGFCLGRFCRTNTIAAPFSPTNIAGLQMWLKADALSLNDGDSVATWTDSSGVGNNMTQVTFGQQPIYKTSIINGKPVVRFNGAGHSSDYMNTSITGLGAARSIFIVLQKRSAASGTTKEAYGFSSGNAAEVLGTNSGFGSGYIYYATQSGGVQALGGAPTSAQIVDHIFASTSNLNTYINSGSNVTLDPNDSYNSTSMTIGDGGLIVGDYGDYDIAEVIVYDTALSDPNRQLVENYLNSKYAIY